MTGERVKPDDSQYTAVWENGIQRWQQSCAEVDPLLERYAKRLRGAIENNVSPVARELIWRGTRGARKSYEYAISIVLEEDSHLRVWGTAWKNDEDLAKQRYLELSTMQFNTPVNASDLDSGLNNFIDSLRKNTYARSTAYQD